MKWKNNGAVSTEIKLNWTIFSICARDGISTKSKWFIFISFSCVLCARNERKANSSMQFVFFPFLFCSRVTFSRWHTQNKSKWKHFVCLKNARDAGVGRTFHQRKLLLSYRIIFTDSTNICTRDMSIQYPLSILQESAFPMSQSIGLD